MFSTRVSSRRRQRERAPGQRLKHRSRRGFFDERDFLGLAETCLKRYDKWREQNFQQQLQAYCTLQMWHVVCGSGCVGWWDGGREGETVCLTCPQWRRDLCALVWSTA